jgi:hypothetical protein
MYYKHISLNALQGHNSFARLKVLMAVLMEISSFWNMPEDGNLEIISVYSGVIQNA